MSREDFEKETGIKFPDPDKAIDQRSAEADYWEQYALWLEKRSKDTINEIFNIIVNRMKANSFIDNPNGIVQNRIVNYADYLKIMAYIEKTYLPTPPDEAKRGRG